MDMRRLVILSFGVKFLIGIFFITLLWAHYFLCQALFDRTVTIDAVRTELEAGADVNARTTSYYSKLNGLTPLMLAATWGDLKRVKLLLEYEADVNLKAESPNKQGDTALHMAIRSATYGTLKNAQKIIQLLLDAGADVNARNNYKDTPLHAVLYVSQPKRRRSIAKLLIKRGADINAQNNNGNTLLHLAVQRGFGPWITWFMEKYSDKIDLSIKNKDGYTVETLTNRLQNMPIMQAVEKGVKAVKKALRTLKQKITKVAEKIIGVLPKKEVQA